jgi:hypothetical protein
MVEVPFKTYRELVERLHAYGNAVAILGCMGELDTTLHIAAGTIDMLQKHVPESERASVGGWAEK